MEKYAYTAAAIPIFILIIISLYVRKTYKGLVNFGFLMINYISLGVALVEIINGSLIFNGLANEVELFFSHFLLTFYFILRNGTIPIYIMFLLLYLKYEKWLENIWFICLLFLPFFFVVGLILSNPFHQLVFSLELNPSDGLAYHRQGWMIALYITAAIYLVETAVLLIISFKRTPLVKWISLFSLIGLTSFAIALQLFFSDIAVEILSTALALLAITFFVLRPEEITNARYGLLSYTAYVDDLKKIVCNKDPVQIQIITFRNINNVIAYFGEDEYVRCIKVIAANIVSELLRIKVYSTVYFEDPGTLYLVINDANLDINHSFYYLRDKLVQTSSSKDRAFASMDVVSTSIKYPNETTDINDILRLGHSFVRFMPKDDLYYPGSKIISSKRYEIETRLPEILRDAIKENRFEMYYQPIYHISSGKFYTAEALIRLNDPNYGFLSPSFFIPAAEQKNLLHPIGDFVLEEVFKFAGSEAFKTLKLHYLEINLSVQQIVDPQLIKQITALQEKYNVDPKNINFEITETLYERKNEIFTRNLKELKRMGYSFSLDDYGTGYSNIQRVLELPLNIIKIDKSMVDASDSIEGHHIIADSIGMMKDINKTVLIEGIETKEKLDEVSAMGAELIQGFYFSKPIPIHQFIEFIQQSNN